MIIAILNIVRMENRFNRVKRARRGHPDIAPATVLVKLMD